MPQNHPFKRALHQIGNDLKALYLSHSVRAILVIVFTFIALLQVGESMIDLADGIKAYRSTIQMTATNNLFDNIFEAAQNLTFERNRSNIALDSPEAIPAMDLQLIYEYRNRSAYLLETALKESICASPGQIAYFEKDLVLLRDLRGYIDRDLKRPLKFRDPLLAGALFSQISDLLSRIEDFLLMTTHVENDPKGLYTKLSLIKLHAFQLRNMIGQEAFIISRALSGREPFDKQTQIELSHLNSRIEFRWLTVKRYYHDVHSHEIKDAADQVEREYFQAYRGMRNSVIAGIAERRYSMTANNYLSAVGLSQDAAENLMYIASAQTRQYSKRIAAQAERKLLFSIWRTVIVLILLGLAILIVSRRVMRPLKQLVEVLRRLRREDYETPIPEIRFHDEFGNLNKGLSDFRDNLIEKKQSEQDKERLILELRDAISKIKTLRGLLPICSSCKKIRNDQGYWQQLESYVADHSEADFSHGICPECARRLYPEYYKKSKKEQD